MKRKRILFYALAFAVVASLGTSAALACDERRELAKFLHIAVDRCMRQDVTIVFDGEIVTDGSRTYVMIDREDGRKLYEMLRDRYETK